MNRRLVRPANLRVRPFVRRCESALRGSATRIRHHPERRCDPEGSMLESGDGSALTAPRCIRATGKLESNRAANDRTSGFSIITTSNRVILTRSVAIFLSPPSSAVRPTILLTLQLEASPSPVPAFVRHKPQDHFLSRLIGICRISSIAVSSFVAYLTLVASRFRGLATVRHPPAAPLMKPPRVAATSRPGRRSTATCRT